MLARPLLQREEVKKASSVQLRLIVRLGKGKNGIRRRSGGVSVARK
jgi:hypothetical protein